MLNGNADVRIEESPIFPVLLILLIERAAAIDQKNEGGTWKI